MKATLNTQQEQQNGVEIINITIKKRHVPLDGIKQDFFKVVEKFNLVAAGGGCYDVRVLYADGGGGTVFGGLYVPRNKIHEVKNEFTSLEYKFDD